MLLSKVTPSLGVNDITATVAFYTEMLGFDLQLAVPNKDAMEWALLKCGSIEIMFHIRKSGSKPVLQDTELTLHLEGDGIKSLYEAVKDKLPIIRHMHPTFYGTYEFSLRDCNGVTLVFVERIKKSEE